MRDDRRVPPSVRPPQQERTRASWQRVLDVGLELLSTGGWDALTVSEVCRRSGISAPSLYARVDGRAGLFLAVYDYGMAAVESTQRRNAVPAPADATLLEAVTAATTGLVRTFEEHRGLLSAVILRASVDADLRRRGAAESRWAIRQAMEKVPGDRRAVENAGRSIFAECVLRIIYGEDFLSGEPESVEAFIDRLSTAATAVIASAGEPGDDGSWPVPADLPFSDTRG
jgi:AcrR family transcriptional regulator